ncbi:MAG TPA: putative metal-binding motif-containing protein [Myxococcus sp.]|nr:putative metal-binding motif-containing protein [Myxococcus sp.]
MVTACEPDESVPDAGPVRTDSGPGSSEDGGADAGTDGGSGVDGGADAGTDGGTQEPAACERTAGVCAGKTRAQVDGGSEPVCTALSYGSDYEQVETRCDGLDNDCDGVADPTHWSRVTELARPPTGGEISSLRVDGGVLVAVVEGPDGARILRLDSRLMPQGESSVPFPRTDGGVEFPTYAELLRTSQGPALYYAMSGNQARLSRIYVAPLEETGAPVPLNDGGTGSTWVIQEERPYIQSRVGVSLDGTRLLFVWGTSGVEQSPRQLKGLLTDGEGEVLAGPKELFRGVTDAGALYAWDVLLLRNGEAAVVTKDEVRYGYEDLVRVQRFDEALDPVGEARAFDMPYEPMPTLVDLGPGAGGPLESPLLLMRRPADAGTHFQAQTVSHLFDGGMPLTRVETQAWENPEDREVPWFGAFASERGLRLAWLSKRSSRVPPTLSGRFWTWEEGGTRRDRSPGPERLPMHVHAQWVLMEELAPGQMGALLMTSSESKHYLEAVRYCAP